METDRLLTDAYMARNRMREARDADTYMDAASALADAFDALDAALTRGGNLPGMWSAAR